MRSKLIILTVFVMISMREEIVGATDCGPNQFYCSICSMWGLKKCYDCKCLASGSKNQSCTIFGCYCHDGHGGFQCNKCKGLSTMVNGRCTCPLPNDCFNWRCDLKNCVCKQGYKGASCNEVTERTITGGAKDFEMDDLYHRVIAIECSGKGYCDIRSIRTTNSKVYLYMFGAKTLTIHPTKPIIYHQEFCTGYTPISQNVGDADCMDGNKKYSGFPAQKVFIHLYSSSKLGDTKVAVKIANFDKSYLVAKADIPIEQNP